MQRHRIAATGAPQSTVTYIVIVLISNSSNTSISIGIGIGIGIGILFSDKRHYDAMLVQCSFYQGW